MRIIKIDSFEYPVLRKKKGINETDDPCPYCGKKHIHGNGNGHTPSNCTDTIVNGEVVTTSSRFKTDHGTFISPARGYIIEEY